MCQIKESIINTEFKDLTPVKLTSKDACETILISLENGHDFPAKVKHWVHANENSKFLIIQ